MKKNQKLLYAILIGFVVVALGFILFQSKNKKSAEVALVSLKERKGDLGKQEEFQIVKKQAGELLSSIKADDKDIQAKLKLAKIYLEEARITGDHAYYDPATLSVLSNVLEKDSLNFEAICFKATVLLSQHHFSEGLELAKKANRIYPELAFPYGLLCDANVELGNYKEAIEAADRMNGIRPDLSSYSRISYLREIYGDPKGAIEAMKMAANAGVASEEPAAWCRVYCGKLFESMNDTATAHQIYLSTLSARPDYPYAIAGLGRIAKQQKQYDKAIEYFTKADGLVEDYSFQMEIGDIYMLQNEEEMAKKAFEKSLAKLQVISNDDNIPGHGHYSDRELANLYTLMGNKELSLKHALIEYNRRPKNLDVNETMAWAKYLRAEYKDAEEYINVALSTNSKNPNVLCKASRIKGKLGKDDESIKLMEKAQEGSNIWNSDLVNTLNCVK